jgi:hypothetical protein
LSSGDRRRRAPKRDAMDGWMRGERVV